MDNLKPLNLKEILTLYQRIERHLPFVASDTEVDVLEYSQQVLDSTLAHNDPEAFIFALEHMAHINMDQILNISSLDRMSLFVRCIVVNRLWVAKEYLRKMGYDTSNG